ncbi:MAG: hypothetical protein IT317_01020 [Anaerolineales bacterium]|nr:hypothetical protein [Anaerolineales bacterium]
MTDQTDPLRARLEADAASPAEADALLPALRALRQWPAPAVTPAATQQLLASLSAASRPVSALPPGHAWRWPLLLLRSQAPRVRRELWWASALIYALGVLVTLAPSFNLSRVETLPFVLLAPAAAAVGCAFLFGPDNDPALELVLALPASPRLLLLARLTLLLAFDLALGLIGSAALAALRAEVVLWPLVLAWLAPMAFLATLGFLLSVLLAEPLAGILISLGLWAARVLGPVWFAGEFWAGLPDLNAPLSRAPLLLAAVGLAAAALWLGGQEERWLPRRARL